MSARTPTLADLWCDPKARDAIQGFAIWVAIWTAVGYLAPSLPHFVPPLFLAGVGVCGWVLAMRYQALSVRSTPVTVEVSVEVPPSVETPALPAPETDTYTDTPAVPDTATDEWWSR